MRDAKRKVEDERRARDLDVLSEVALGWDVLVVRRLGAELEALCLVALLLVAGGRAAVRSPARRTPGRNAAVKLPGVSQGAQAKAFVRDSRKVEFVDLNERET